jgi:pimeloyl-ACP methyl ester carboxylesterase
MGSRIWKEVAHQLTGAGRRVLLFDLYGRGFSDAAFPNDLGLFVGK